MGAGRVARRTEARLQWFEPTDRPLMRADPPARPSRARDPRPGRRSAWHARLHEFFDRRNLFVFSATFSGASLLTAPAADVVSGCHQTFPAGWGLTGVGAMPAPLHRPGRPTCAEPGGVRSRGQGRRRRLSGGRREKATIGVRVGFGTGGCGGEVPLFLGRGRRPRDARGVARGSLFTTPTSSPCTPAERADVGIFAASTIDASRGPTASVPGWRTNEKPGDEAFCGNTAVSAFDSVSRAAAAADLRRPPLTYRPAAGRRARQATWSARVPQPSGATASPRGARLWRCAAPSRSVATRSR